MKSRIVSAVAAAGLAVALAAAPASALVSAWQSTNGSIDASCATVLHGHSSTKAYINSGGCQWYVGIRAQYNELGTNYTTAWVNGSTAVSVIRDRIYLHQYSY